MDDRTNHDRAIELLQELGLKEYESKCFVALSRLPQGTAKEISEISEVPRTRVYDAVRVLESKGLVEIQHSSPQVFRATSIDEAAETLRAEFAERADTLRETLRGMEPVSHEEEAELTHEVWALSGPTAVTSRVRELVAAADEEVMLIVGREDLASEELVATLRDAQQRGVDVVVGTPSDDVADGLDARLPEAEVFVSGLEWLTGQSRAGEPEVGRLVLVDRSAILVSTVDDGAGGADEFAVFGRGFGNGLVVVFRRLLATGLLPVDDPAPGN